MPPAAGSALSSSPSKRLSSTAYSPTVRLAAAIALALALALPAAAAPPAAGVLVPGRSLGGLELGATKAEVERSWGRAYGVCRNCVRETWYFNYYAFQPRGAGVEWRDGGRSACSRSSSRSGGGRRRGSKLNDPAARITGMYGPLSALGCGSYSVLTLDDERDDRVLRPR